MAKSKSKSKKRPNKNLPPAYTWLIDLKKTDLPIYLLHGEESMFSQQAAEWLQQRGLGTGIADFNLDRFDASEGQFSVSALLNALNTQPMMNDKRVVRLQAAELLNKVPKTKLGELIQYCAAPNPHTCFILEARDRLDQTRALMKALNKSEFVVCREAATMSSSQVDFWLESEAKRLNLALSREALTLIQESGSGRLGEMSDALTRLSLFIEPRTEATIDDVVTLLPKAKAQTTVWILLDKLALRQTREVISLVRTLLDGGQEVLGIVALVHRRLRELLAAKSVMQLGGGEANLAQVLQVNGYAAKRVIQLAQNRNSMTIKQLASGFELLAWADRTLKGAKVDQEVLLEYVLIKLCTDPD